MKAPFEIEITFLSIRKCDILKVNRKIIIHHKVNKSNSIDYKLRCDQLATTMEL